MGKMFERRWKRRVGGRVKKDSQRFFYEEDSRRVSSVGGREWEVGEGCLFSSLEGSRFDRESNRIWSHSSAVGFPLSARV
jgi:hypothetical protein